MINGHDIEDMLPGTPDDAQDEPGYCPGCNGSGEGQTDGSTCWQCKGRGES